MIGKVAQVAAGERMAAVGGRMVGLTRAAYIAQVCAPGPDPMMHSFVVSSFSGSAAGNQWIPCKQGTGSKTNSTQRSKHSGTTLQENQKLEQTKSSTYIFHARTATEAVRI
jgi:hypothetical protein